MVIILPIIAGALIYHHHDKKRKAKKAARLSQQVEKEHNAHSHNDFSPPAYENRSQPPQYLYLTTHSTTAAEKQPHPEYFDDSENEASVPTPLIFVRRSSSASSHVRLDGEGSNSRDSSLEIADRLDHEMEMEAPPIPTRSSAREPNLI